MTDGTSDPGSLVVVASNLRPDEARAVRRVLESAGIVPVAWSDSLRGSEGHIGAANEDVAVAAADAQRARRILRSSGVLS